jgi:hypothetical protein
MKTRVIIQINIDTGQKNVTFTTDRLTPLSDFLVDSWENSRVIQGTVLILSMEPTDVVVDELMDTELHSVYGTDESIEITEDDCRRLLERVKDGLTCSDSQ